MVDDRTKRIQDDEEKLERAARPHDWGEEVVEDAVDGLLNPITGEHVHEEDAPPEDDKRVEEEQRDAREADERLNEVW